MDPAQLSLIAVTILTPLTPYLIKTGEAFAEEIGKELFAQGKSLFLAIRKKLDQMGDTYTKTTLDKLDKASDVEKNQLKEKIFQQMQEDGEFANTVLIQVNSLTTLLFDCLKKKFLIKDLKEVYFRLGIGWNDLTGEVATRDEKAIALIEYVKTRERIPELIKAMWTVFPGIHC